MRRTGGYLPAPTTSETFAYERWIPSRESYGVFSQRIQAKFAQHLDREFAKWLKEFDKSMSPIEKRRHGETPSATDIPPYQRDRRPR